MDIMVGDRIILQFSTFEDRFLGEVFDITDSGHLLVNASVPSMVRTRLTTDLSASVKYAFDGKLLGFSTRVIAPHGRINGTIELEGPASVFDAEERSEPRCSCFYPALLVEAGRAVEGVVEDLSPSCARVRIVGLDAPLYPERVGRLIRLTFSDIADPGIFQSVDCMIIKAFMKEGEQYVILRYNEHERNAKKRIAHFIQSQVCCILPRM